MTKYAVYSRPPEKLGVSPGPWQLWYGSDSYAECAAEYATLGVARPSYERMVTAAQPRVPGGPLIREPWANGGNVLLGQLARN